MNLVQSLAETAKKKGDKPAYIFMDQSVSYDQLNKMVTRFSSNLAEMGIGKRGQCRISCWELTTFFWSVYTEQ